MANKTLTAAKGAKQDEFYTQLTDIEKELKHYRKCFKDKTVLCNCDDPRISNFFRYFALNFEKLGLKRLITTCYKNQDIDIFSEHEQEQAVYLIYDGDKNGNGIADLEEIEVLPLNGDGDFRSNECIELLKQADIVVTNPPFSLFREYVAQLIKYDKKFLIIGNQNNVTYKETFQLIMDNKLWIGYMSGDMAFRVPQDYEAHDTRFWIDNQGQKWRSLGNICWYTNLPTQKRDEELILFKKYNPSINLHYDNYDAINVDKVDDIPCDYDGVMGVPITFIDKYNPKQFEIVGLTSGRDEFIARPTKRYINPIQHNKNGSTTNGSKANTRATILLPQIPHNQIYYTADNADGALKILYARILIRKKQ